MAKKKRGPGRPKKYKKKPVKFNLSFDPDLKERVIDEAKSRNIKPNEMVMEAIRYYFAPHDDPKPKIKKPKPKKIAPISKQILDKLFSLTRDLEHADVFIKAGTQYTGTTRAGVLREFISNMGYTKDAHSQKILVGQFLEEFKQYEDIEDIKEHLSLQEIIKGFKDFLELFEG